MIDYKEITEEINRLEEGNTSYSTCEKLSVLYSVMDHQEKGQSFAAAPFSEFTKAFEEAPRQLALEIIDEHFDAIRELYPREYRRIIKLLRST